ncbi:bifunctional precorrin-2 dehydrogenase/sirohydrochlorin ferrochelatase [uncultured Kordia sp.]|uniref:precorrin-2 dehydrogenase/sirohydrochlorin ferrochelatase family protein n=1 Tax=uncultured Kordia sp. TaxID=507699 RepID=UPI00261F4FD0|nr:bifunctional precorrin-2 dehydrogenase/sirohydrochlorin ferrochelatase [uncultured Kordia sp.]
MEKNELYPIFLKVQQLQVLIVGGGNVGLEKISFLLKSSPNAQVSLVAPFIKEEIRVLATLHPTVTLIEDTFNNEYLDEKHIVIAATDDQMVNLNIFLEAKRRHLLVNLADQPQYCDFYLGGIVTKGNVKIAISTNGKSPTTAKRLRQFFEQIIPESIDELVQNLHSYRKRLHQNFEQKVDTLNDLTKSLLHEKIEN